MRRHLRWHCFPSVPYPGLTYPEWRAADRHGRRAGHQARAVGEYLQACICRLGLEHAFSANIFPKSLRVRRH